MWKKESTSLSSGGWRGCHGFWLTDSNGEDGALKQQKLHSRLNCQKLECHDCYNEYQGQNGSQGDLSK